MMRLVKYVAQAGIASRRKSEELVKRGHVTVNGRRQTDPSVEVKTSDKVRVDRKEIKPESAEHYLLNKPLGVISTARDTHGRPTVVKMIDSRKRLYPVGRLDADTSGLIIVSNDGDLANQLTHPKFEVPKTYRVTVWGVIGNAVVEKLRKGVQLDDGPTAPAKVRRVGQVANRTTLDLTIHEGRNRQVRRMCAAVGCPIMELTRIKFGNVNLGDLPLGHYRKMTPVEVVSLRKLAAKHVAKTPTAKK